MSRPIEHAEPHPGHGPSNIGHTLAWAAVAYTAFVIYGSLVPLEFRAIPWNEALAKFREVPFLTLGIGSRADWVANLLLFIPLAFLWMGAFGFARSVGARTISALVVMASASLLSAGIEFAQLFFPQRTVSLNDVAAESLGGAIGVLAWLFMGKRFVRWYDGWRLVRGRATLAERLAWFYVAGVFIYNVLPLDLTISAVEIFHKWREGKVRLIPFSGFAGDPVQVFYELLTDAAIWMLPAFLWRLGTNRPAGQIWAMTTAIAGILEMLQLFVYSRVSDVTDVFTGALGAAAGVLLAERFVDTKAEANPAGSGKYWQLQLLPPLAALGWLGVLVAVFWYPFNFQVDAAFVKERLDFLGRVPFEVYYFGTEYRAATEFLHKTLFFAPLGALAGWAVESFPWRWRRTAAVAAVIVVVLVALGIELGQVLLPGKIPDMTDWLLESGGAIAGFVFARYVLRVTKPYPGAGQPSSSHAAVPAPPRTESTFAPPSRNAGPVDLLIYGNKQIGVTSYPARTTRASDRLVRWHAFTSVSVITLAIWGATQLPFVPYNVRELLDVRAPILSAIMLALCCYWLAFWPVRLARGTTASRSAVWDLPLGVLLYGGITYLLLRFAVPEESLDDIIGAPVLGWPWEWERLLRFLALAAVPGVLLYLAAQSARQIRGRRLGAWHWAVGLIVLAIAYWVVVAQASTDNLVELMAPQPFGFVMLCTFLFVTFLAAALLASPPPRGERRVPIVVLVLSLPLAMTFLNLGLAGEIQKYGQRFSALQFLLSTDRDHYAGIGEAWIRYGVLHVLFVAILAALQWPHFRSRRC